MVSQKLKHYFLEHPSTVVSSTPIKDFIQNREAIERIAKGAIELGPRHVKYMPRTAINSHAVVDFINDWTELQIPEDRLDNTHWTIHFDGSIQLEGSGAGVVLSSPRGAKFCYVISLMFPCTNNAAGYEALLHGLRIAKDMNLSGVRCLGDLDLVAQQVSGTWDSKDPLMSAYRHAVTEVAGYFHGYQVDHIDHGQNEAACRDPDLRVKITEGTCSVMVKGLLAFALISSRGLGGLPIQLRVFLYSVNYRQKQT